MSEESETLVRQLLQSAEQQGLDLDKASLPKDPASLLVYLHAAAQGDPLPETITELMAALSAALTRTK